jgi:phage/plasmid-associated DNA primase
VKDAPPEVMQATEEYRNEEDALSKFIDSRFDIGPELETQASLLRKAYEHWCKENGEAPLNDRQLPARLREKGYTSMKKGGLNYWLGSSLKSLEASESGTAESRFAAPDAINDSDWHRMMS